MSRRFGSQCIVLSVDARRVPDGEKPQPSGYEVTTHGGRRSAGIDASSGPSAPGARRRGDPAELDGRRRHPRRLRPGHADRGPEGGRRPGDRLRWCRRGRALRPGRAGRSGRGAGRERVPLRAAADRRGQGRAAGRGGRDPMTAQSVRLSAAESALDPAVAAGSSATPTAWSAPSSSPAPARC
ncbi:hypothetical protein L7F22_041286 [Adiantum nelumboides]|nr:hypothetical protein [Adiantum nelumboides]